MAGVHLDLDMLFFIGIDVVEVVKSWLIYGDPDDVEGGIRVEWLGWSLTGDLTSPNERPARVLTKLALVVYQRDRSCYL